MTNAIYVGGKRHRLDATRVVGQGGEAVVYELSPQQVAKIYLSPSDPVYAGNPDAQLGATDRIKEHQRKLPAFPKNLPVGVVAPLDLARERPNGPIIGYTMTNLKGADVLLRFADRKFREQGGIDANQAVEVFRKLHDLVQQVHRAGVVIGDFNDLNVLVTPGGDVRLVDADSMQFGPFLCKTFTTRFVDPLHCRPDKLLLAVPHSSLSDWYAYATMLFQSLLFINPYGGVHKPKGGEQQLRDASRILHRLTIFSPNVKTPKAAVPFEALPDDLLAYFTELYEQDQRGEFPLKLLEDLRWTACMSCGITHARAICPACATSGVIKQVITVRGSVTAARLFRTDGQIMFATHQGGELRYVYHERGAYWREGEVRVVSGSLDPKLRIRIWGERTVLGKGQSLVAVGRETSQLRVATQLFGRLPVFAANAKHLYWLDGDRLVSDSFYGASTIGNVLPNRTLIWAGERFGFGFFRAGSLTRGLVFDAERVGINDTVPLPPMKGNLIDATCTFADRLAWFMITIEDGGTIKNHCYVIDDKAQLLAHAEAVQGDGSWLGESIRGHLALGQALFAATDAGIVRIKSTDSSLRIEREYPDTEPFVSADAQLLPSREGIVVVSRQEITLLKIK